MGHSLPPSQSAGENTLGGVCSVRMHPSPPGLCTLCSFIILVPTGCEQWMERCCLVCSRRAGIKPQTRLLLCFLPLPFLPPAQGFHWDSLGWKLRELSAGAALRFLMLEESRGSLFVFHPLCQNISGCSVEGAVILRFLAVSRVIGSSCSPAWLLQLFQLI